MLQQIDDFPPSHQKFVLSLWPIDQQCPWLLQSDAHVVYLSWHVNSQPSMKLEVWRHQARYKLWRHFPDHSLWFCHHEESRDSRYCLLFQQWPPDHFCELIKSGVGGSLIESHLWQF